MQRFEKDFFAIDTNRIKETLPLLQQQYPNFIYDFTEIILGLPQMRLDNDTLVQEVKFFLQSFRSFADSIEQKYKNVDDLQKALSAGFQRVKYYYKNYREPAVVTFVGPFNSTNIGFNGQSNTLCIGLQFYLGNQFSAYQTPWFVQEYPAYISRRFDKAYIVADVFKSIVQNQLYTDTTGSLPLVYRMIENAKRYYLLDKFLPYEADSIKMGYTQQQIDWCKKNEKEIWKFFIDQDLLYSIDASTEEYLTDGPFTNGMPQDASPGNIGLFVGWQILSKYLSNKSLPLNELLQTPAKTIFNEAKYKP